MRIRLYGKIRRIDKDKHNTGRYQAEVKAEQDIGTIILFNIKGIDYIEIKEDDNIEIELDTATRYIEKDDTLNVYIRKTCIVFINDIYFKCCVENKALNVSRI